MTEPTKTPIMHLEPVNGKATKIKSLFFGTTGGESHDVAAQFLAHLDPSIAEEPVTRREERRLLWKIDLILIPLISATLILGAVDKVIVSNAAIYGVRYHIVCERFRRGD